jgi:hypothetical protein
MAKTPSLKLFRLIKSLSPTERRYFKVRVNPTGDRTNKYALLFDAIYAQESYDDAALQSLVYPGEQIESRKFSELKAYLYDTILHTLQTYDEKTSVEYRIKSYLLDIKVLFKRSLYSECNLRIQKAKKLCNEYQEFGHLLELLRWEKELAYARTDIDFLDAQLANIALEEKAALEQLELQTTYRNLFLEMLVELRKDVSRSKEQLERLKKLAAQPIITDPPADMGFWARIYHLRFLSLYQYSVSDFHRFYQSSKELVKTFESKKEFLKEDVSEYISAINNHVISCGNLDKLGEVRDNLEKLKALTPITGDDQLKIHRQYYMNMFRLCIETGDFKRGLEELGSHQKEIQKFEKAAFEKGNFYFQYFTIYFANGEFDLALEYLNEWLNMPKNVERQDLQALARVVNLLIHFEMGNFVLLQSLIRSTKRYLTKEKRIYQFETYIMDYLGQIDEVTGKKKQKDLLEKLGEQLHSLENTQPDATMMRYFNFQSWVRSKIEKISFSEAVQNDFRKRSLKKHD